MSDLILQLEGAPFPLLLQAAPSVPLSGSLVPLTAPQTRNYEQMKRKLQIPHPWLGPEVFKNAGKYDKGNFQAIFVFFFFVVNLLVRGREVSLDMPGKRHCPQFPLNSYSVPYKTQLTSMFTYIYIYIWQRDGNAYMFFCPVKRPVVLGSTGPSPTQNSEVRKRVGGRALATNRRKAQQKFPPGLRLPSPKGEMRKGVQKRGLHPWHTKNFPAPTPSVRQPLSDPTGATPPPGPPPWGGATYYRGRLLTSMPQCDWTTGVTGGVPDNGNEWRKFHVVPRSHPLRPLLCALSTRGGKRRAFILPGPGVTRGGGSCRVLQIPVIYTYTFYQQCAY